MCVKQISNCALKKEITAERRPFDITVGLRNVLSTMFQESNYERFKFKINRSIHLSYAILRRSAIFPTRQLPACEVDTAFVLPWLSAHGSSTEALQKRRRHCVRIRKTGSCRT
jgi:hypothetical protein